MDFSDGKAILAARLQEQVFDIVVNDGAQAGGFSVHDMVQVLAGIMIESVFLFDEPDAVLTASHTKLERLLNASAFDGTMPDWCQLDPATLDWRTEQGRLIARNIIDEWPDCPFTYMDFMLFSLHNFMVQWAENHNVPRAEALRLLREASLRGLAFEVTAQELCLEVIDRQMTEKGWTIADCLCGLSGYAGQALAELHETLPGGMLNNGDDPVDTLMHVMAQEAVRLGVPAGSEWRLGLAANDCPADPPVELIRGVLPIVQGFFGNIRMHEPLYRAVACAKAAGRMLAVVASGEMPDMPPMIAKPLAAMAMTEAYRALNATFPPSYPRVKRGDNAARSRASVHKI
ncbi:MAG: hypothetical protein V4621_05115 [Pseudomonadota bacterium]